MRGTRESTSVALEPGDRGVSSEEHLLDALSAANVGSWEWQINTNRVTWSASLERIHGLQPGTFDGAFDTFRRGVYAEDLAIVDAAIALALETGHHNVEYRVCLPGGGLRWVSGRGQVLRDSAGRPESIVGICMDVTREKRAEASLRLLVEAGERLGSSLDFEENFRQLARTVVPGFADWCVINLVRRDQRLRRVAIVHRDPARQAMADELVGNPLLRSSEVIRDLGQGRSLVFERVDQEQLRAFFKDVPNGEQIIALGWGSCIITPLVARGLTLGAITFVRLPGSPPYDGTDLDLGTQLARRAALSFDNSRLYSESERVRQELAAANQVKDEFLDMVSHEMRTPLTFLQAGTSLLARRRGQLGEDELAALIADLESQGVQLQTMVENLLALARTGGAESLELEPLRVDRVVQSALDPIRARYPQRTVEVEVSGLPYVAAHGPSLERIVRNMISNAVKYSPAAEPIAIDASVLEDGRVALRVRDHGPGVSPDDLERIFERFYRSPRTATKSPGSGIGLALCRRLARMMGGDVLAENRDGGGLDVSVVLRPYGFEESEEPADVVPAEVEPAAG